jgi:hypothetical protein
MKFGDVYQTEGLLEDDKTMTGLPQADELIAEKLRWP